MAEQRGLELRSPAPTTKRFWESKIPETRVAIRKLRRDELDETLVNSVADNSSSECARENAILHPGIGPAER